MKTFLHGLSLVAQLFHRLAFALVVLCALGAMAYTSLCVLGLAPWLELDMALGGERVDHAGIWVQSALTALAVMLAFYLPSVRRIMMLENSHRSFQLGMEDVARAYHYAHAADRSGIFKLSSEFDSVRERLVYLREHPELSTLEPEMLELAAQMSHLSQELASVYSDDAIFRARDFLRQRQTEIESFNKRLDTAKSISTELKHWLHEVELEESVAAAQLERLRDDLHEVLPELGTTRIVELEAESENLTRLPRAAE